MSEVKLLDMSEHVPWEIVQEAKKVETFMAQKCATPWSIGGIQSRANLAERDAEVEGLRADLDATMDGRNGEMRARLAAEARAERLAGALRGMLELRELTQRGEVHPNRHELDVVSEARAALGQENDDA